MHRLPYVQRHLQKHVDEQTRCGIYVLQQCGNKARHRLSETLGGSGKIPGRLGSENGKLQLKSGSKASRLLQLFTTRTFPEIDDYYEPWN